MCTSWMFSHCVPPQLRDHQRYELFGKLMRPVVIGTIADRGLQSVGMVLRAHEMIRGSLAGRTLILIAALAVKLSSPGPILFKQRRYGLHGEEIRVYKFAA